MRYIDTHAHVNFSAFKKDSKEVIAKHLQEGIGMVLVGSQFSTSKRAVEMAEKYESQVYASVGVHPIHLMEKQVTEEKDTFKTASEFFDKERYADLVRGKKKVKAVGEIGLDYYWISGLSPQEQEKEKTKQKESLRSQFEFAWEMDLPVILHCRKAHWDLIKFLEDLRKKRGRSFEGVVHSFGGNDKQARVYVEMGFYLGFNGIITYSESYDRAIASVPKEKILLETDCPYLTPAPLSKEERNEPRNVCYVARKIARIWDLPVLEVAEITTRNAKEVLKL